ncbi:MAG: ABC transporter permease subunit [Alphaproteobacteria bacterium]
MISLISKRAELTEKAVEIKGRSLWDDAIARLMRNQAAVTGMVLLSIITLLAIFAPLIGDLTGNAYDELDYEYIYGPPSLEGNHFFGTDGNGRDLFVRTLYGARTSLAIGVVATAVSLLIGVIWGATAGFIGGRVDELMMRFVDVLYSLPYIFFVIILLTIFGRNFILLFVAIGAVEWLTMARIVRSQTVSIKRKEFIEAAEAAGVDAFTMIRRHIIPNVMGPVVVYVTLTIPVVILAESFLSFLGLGVQEPNTSWGRLISEGARDALEQAPWMMAFPAAFMAATLFCFNFIGDGLRDALDPKDR